MSEFAHNLAHLDRSQPALLYPAIDMLGGLNNLVG